MKEGLISIADDFEAEINDKVETGTQLFID